MYSAFLCRYGKKMRWPRWKRKRDPASLRSQSTSTPTTGEAKTSSHRPDELKRVATSSDSAMTTDSMLQVMNIRLSDLKTKQRLKFNEACDLQDAMFRNWNILQIIFSRTAGFRTMPSNRARISAKPANFSYKANIKWEMRFTFNSEPIDDEWGDNEPLRSSTHQKISPLSPVWWRFFTLPAKNTASHVQGTETCSRVYSVCYLENAQMLCGSCLFDHVEHKDQVIRYTRDIYDQDLWPWPVDTRKCQVHG